MPAERHLRLQKLVDEGMLLWNMSVIDDIRWKRNINAVGKILADHTEIQANCVKQMQLRQAATTCGSRCILVGNN